MKRENQNLELEEVLFAFHKACSDPTAVDIANWTKKYPQYSDDILAHAALMKDSAACEKLGIIEPDAKMLSIGQSRTMDLLHKARAAAKAESVGAKTFDEIMKAAGTNIPDLARKLDITRGVLAALVGGRIQVPIGRRLADALTNVLSISIEKFDRAVEAALLRPKLGMLKAEGNAKVNVNTYEELINSSAMSESRKRFWLGKE